MTFTKAKVYLQFAEHLCCNSLPLLLREFIVFLCFHTVVGIGIASIYSRQTSSTLHIKIKSTQSFNANSCIVWLTPQPTYERAKELQYPLVRDNLKSVACQTVNDQKPMDVVFAQEVDCVKEAVLRVDESECSRVPAQIVCKQSRNSGGHVHSTAPSTADLARLSGWFVMDSTEK